jgi:hypothetical protein
MDPTDAPDSRNLEDRSIIDHLASRVFKRTTPSDRAFSEVDGRVLQEAIERNRAARRGGLADF